MKTLVVYTEDNLSKFFVLDGDYSHLDGTFINDSEDEDKIYELEKILYNNPDEGDYSIKQIMLDHIPLDQQPFDKQINIGFVV